MPDWPTPLPSWFWPWAAWLDQGRPKGRRPVSAPREIPAWAWRRYQLHRGRVEQEIGPARSPWSGRGIFTVEHPGEVSDYGLRLDYLLRATSPYSWSRDPAPGAVYQAETDAQLRVALATGAASPPWERALVTNLAPLTSWPDGWTCLLECYWNADGGHPDVGRSIPRMVWEARRLIGPAWGRVPVVLVPGLYDASGENPGTGVRLTWGEYAADIAWAEASYPCVVGVCPWRVETLDGADLAGLR